MFNRIKAVFLFCSLLVLSFTVKAWPVNSDEFQEPDVRSSMYANKAFIRQQYAFSPYDTIYMVLDFPNLEPGEYVMTTDWIRPGGVVEYQDNHAFVLDIFEFFRHT